MELPDFPVGTPVWHGNLRRPGIYLTIDDLDKVTAHVHFSDTDETLRVSRRWLSRHSQPVRIEQEG